MLGFLWQPTCAGSDTWAAPTTVTQTVTTTRVPHQGPFANRGPLQNHVSPRPNHDTHSRINPHDARAKDFHSTKSAAQAEAYGNRSGAGLGATRRPDSLQSPVPDEYRDDDPNYLRSLNYSQPVAYGNDTIGLARQKSIPRKQVGTSAQAPQTASQVSTLPNLQKGQDRQRSFSKALPPAPVSAHKGHDFGTDVVPQSTSIFDRSRPIDRGRPEPRDVQDVINRAHSNTHDTDVIEKIAPGEFVYF